jgi:pSer/pThr/pTyr-binding forkhead associated (FHA) protein
MHATEVPAPRAARDEATIGATQATARHDLDIVLKPLSRPDLGEIRIDGVLAVGRAEQPFATYDADIVMMLSRRHARIFCEAGVVYLADLESRNGTTVNRAAVREAPCRLNDGDEICFGGVLTYRVEIAPRAMKSRPEDVFTLTLTPESAASGLETIVITRFPFLVSKTDEAFSRDRNEHALHLGYLSRRHAHIFQKGGGAYIEDLASTNGTFVDGQRLQECAVPLQDGALLAFGGDHFTYRVSVRKPAEIDTGAARESAPAAAGKAVENNPATGKTTFVVAPTSFLEIFCVDHEPAESTDGSRSTLPAVADQAPARRRARGRSLALLSELAAAFGSSDPDRAKRNVWRGVALAALLGAVVVALTLWGASDRELKDLVARGEYAQAALLANRSLEQNPDDAELKALATEAALKANVPAWLAKVAARDFDGAAAVVAGMSELGVRNPELRPLVGELEWLGQLERLVSSRGGPEMPIRIYADEESITAVIDRWNDGTRYHERALARIASHVPQFSGPYAEALTHLRKLQSEATVHLAAIDRLKATIAADMKRDRPDALDAVLKEYAQKYPGLGGLDSVRQDLARYMEIREEARARTRGRLFALMLKARFVTPPFQEGFRALASSGQLPPADLVQQYEVATKAWKEGNASQALAGLQKMAVGPWAETALKELERKQAVMTQFAALQQSRATSGYAEQLLAFRATLDPEEDVHFARATQADLDQQKDKVLARAQDSMNRARALWQEYRDNGAIEAAQRIETTISSQFRTRARLLSEAGRHAQQGMQMYAQVNATQPEPWTAIHDEIRTEAQQQRRALLELRNVLEPELLKTKLGLLGETGDDARN